MLLALASRATVAVAFNLWMSHAGVDTFYLIVNYVYNDWEPRHIIVGILKHKML